MLKEVDKSKTREQFLSERLLETWCPQAFGLRNTYGDINCKGVFICKRCWEDATKYIKFLNESNEC